MNDRPQPVDSSDGPPPGLDPAPERVHGAEDAALTEAEHDTYWRANYAGRPYTDSSLGYEHYRPAFRYGWESRSRYPGRRFEDVEEALRAGWNPDAAGLSWDEARPAVREAFARPSGLDAAGRDSAVR